MYNTQTNIKEKKLISFIDKSKKELVAYGLSDIDINNILDNQYELDLCSCDVEKILINITICEFLWYNKIYQEKKYFKSSLPKKFVRNHTDNTTDEQSHYDTFISTMALIVQKYGKEFLDN